MTTILVMFQKVYHKYKAKMTVQNDDELLLKIIDNLERRDLVSDRSIIQVSFSILVTQLSELSQIDIEHFISHMRECINIIKEAKG